MTTKPKSQLERVRGKLLRDGAITRNQCLSQFPAITRLAARIADLKAQGYVFRAEDTGRDEVYHLVNIKGKPYVTPANLRVAAENIKWFEDHQSEDSTIRTVT
jgi:hypothetical protein